MVYLNDNVQFVIDFCRKYIPEIVPVMPEATYMIWLDCRGLGLNSSELGAFFVKKARVGLNDGSSFGPGGEGFMRMNLATSRGKLIKAFDQIRKAVEECRL
jgi:cystathionine beta-lyase